MVQRTQQIRFCTSRDGTRIAYASTGGGPPLVRAPHPMSHLKFDWESPVWRHWLSLFAQHHTLIRYDLRGCGLSDRERVNSPLRNSSRIWRLSLMPPASGALRYSECPVAVPLRSHMPPDTLTG